MLNDVKAVSILNQQCSTNAFTVFALVIVEMCKKKTRTNTLNVTGHQMLKRMSKSFVHPPFNIIQHCSTTFNTVRQRSTRSTLFDDVQNWLTTFNTVRQRSLLLDNVQHCSITLKKVKQLFLRQALHNPSNYSYSLC